MNLLSLPKKKNLSSHNKYNCPCQEWTLNVSYNPFNKTPGKRIMESGVCVVNQSKVPQAIQMPSTNQPVIETGNAALGYFLKGQCDGDSDV